MPAWHPWPLLCPFEDSPTPAARKGDSERVETSQGAQEKAQPPSRFSQNENTVMFIMFSASETTVWQQQLAAPQGDITSPFLSLSVTADPHRKNSWDLRALPLHPPPWLRPLGWGDAQAPSADGEGRRPQGSGAQMEETRVLKDNTLSMRGHRSNLFFSKSAPLKPRGKDGLTLSLHHVHK